MRAKWEERGSDGGTRAFKTQSGVSFRSFQSDVSSLADNHYSSPANFLSYFDSFSKVCVPCVISNLPLPWNSFWPFFLFSFGIVFKATHSCFCILSVRVLRSIYLVLHMLMQICVCVPVGVWGFGSCLRTYSVWIHNSVLIPKLHSTFTQC